MESLSPESEPIIDDTTNATTEKPSHNHASDAKRPNAISYALLILKIQKKPGQTGKGHEPQSIPDATRKNRTVDPVVAGSSPVSVARPKSLIGNGLGLNSIVTLEAVTAR